MKEEGERERRSEKETGQRFAVTKTQCDYAHRHIQITVKIQVTVVDALFRVCLINVHGKIHSIFDGMVRERERERSPNYMYAIGFIYHLLFLIILPEWKARLS